MLSARRCLWRDLASGSSPHGRRQGWTRRELANRAGLHEQHLAKVERGDRYRIEADTILKLAQALGCTTDYLMGLTDDPRPPTTAAPYG